MQDTKCSAEEERVQPDKKQRRNIDSFSLLQAPKRYAAKLQLQKMGTAARSKWTWDASWWCASLQLHTAAPGLNPEIKRIGRD